MRIEIAQDPRKAGKACKGGMRRVKGPKRTAQRKSGELGRQVKTGALRRGLNHAAFLAAGIARIRYKATLSTEARLAEAECALSTANAWGFRTHSIDESGVFQLLLQHEAAISGGFFSAVFELFIGRPAQPASSAAAAPWRRLCLSAGREARARSPQPSPP